MLFRNSDGDIIDIKRTDFKNDQTYYAMLMKIKINTNKTEINTTSTQNNKKTKMEAFFDKCKEANTEFNVVNQAKPNVYSKQAIDKLMNEFF